MNELYRVLYKQSDGGWRVLYTRNNGPGVYDSEASARNAIKQVKRYAPDLRIERAVTDWAVVEL